MNLPEALRQATRAAHHDLDHHPLLAPLVREGLSLAAYADALAGLHGIQAAAEQAAAAGLTGGNYPWQPRLADLAADLAALGRTPWPRTLPPPPCTAPGAVIGLMYVLEGSRLGARVIARQSALQLPRAPRRFFSGPPPDWTAFTVWAASQDTPAIRATILTSAQDWFAAWRRHLDQCAERRAAGERVSTGGI